MRTKTFEFGDRQIRITLYMNAVALGEAMRPNEADEQKASMVAERYLPLTGQDPMQNFTNFLRQQALKSAFLNFGLYSNR